MALPLTSNRAGPSMPHFETTGLVVTITLRRGS